MLDKITATKNQKLAAEIHQRFPLPENVYNAIAKTDRELFVSSGFKHHAFKLDALPIGADQWISSPLTVAKMSCYLEAEGADSVLEIGCGSGYQAAILSHLFRRVFSIERINQLLEEARSRFKQSSYTNINTRLADGQQGWRQFAPYDRILFSASLSSFPESLTDQLSEGGIMIAPFDHGNQQIIKRFVKRGGSIREENLESCRFVPVLDGIVK